MTCTLWFSTSKYAPMSYTPEQRTRAINQVTLWAVAVNLLLAVIKVIGGIIGHSQALIADGLHSFSDLASDGMVLVAAKHASADADDDHPYGHARFETLATVALGSLLLIVGAGICYDAIHRLLNDAPEHIPHHYTMFVAAVSILSNEALYHYTKHVGVKIKSNLLIANAWHHRSDAISSIVVLIGIGGTMINMPYLDGIAAIVVALMIAKIGIELSYKSVMELVDTAVEPELVDAIKEKILTIDDVKELHMLRTRRMGQHALVDVHIMVAPRLSVSEGHHISETVEKALIDSFEDVNDVTVHIDPEDDEIVASSKHLPRRTELIIMLNQAWSREPELKAINDITLHYLNGKISVEAAYPMENLDSVEELKKIRQLFEETSLKVQYINEACINFR